MRRKSKQMKTNQIYKLQKENKRKYLNVDSACICICITRDEWIEERDHNVR